MGDNIENSIEMEGPSSCCVGRWWERGSRGQLVAVKIAYQLTVTESVEKHVPVKPDKIGPGLKHLVNKRNSDVVIKCGTSQFDTHKLTLTCKPIQIIFKRLEKQGIRYSKLT